MKNLIPYAWKTFYVIFLAAFIPGIFAALFRSHTGMNPIVLPLITVGLFLPLLIGAWRLSRHIAISPRSEKIVLISFINATANHR